MRNLVLCLLAMVLMSCSNTQSTTQELANVTSLKSLVENGTYEIESDQAMPQASRSIIQVQNSGLLGIGNNAASINLIGNPNYLRVMGDSVKAELPYFGERQMGGSYGGRDEGIKFNGLMTDYSSEWNEKKNRYIIKFRADSNNEQYLVILNLFPNRTTSMMVNGNQHTPIRYQGYLKEISKDQKDH